MEEELPRLFLTEGRHQGQSALQRRPIEDANEKVFLLAAASYSGVVLWQAILAGAYQHKGRCGCLAQAQLYGCVESDRSVHQERPKTLPRPNCKCTNNSLQPAKLSLHIVQK